MLPFKSNVHRPCRRLTDPGEDFLFATTPGSSTIASPISSTHVTSIRRGAAHHGGCVTEGIHLSSYPLTSHTVMHTLIPLASPVPKLSMYPIRGWAITQSHHCPAALRITVLSHAICIQSSTGLGLLYTI